MILDEATKEAFGYYASELKPQSNKPILAACETCGKIRVTPKYCYRSFCKSCAYKSEYLSKETKAKQSAARKGRTHTEESKVAMSKNHADFKGKKNPRWRGGISFEPYCIKFNNKYKDKIRNLFGNECFLCGMSEKDNGQALSVHHVNYNKVCGCDDTKCICVPLCIRCHNKTGADRDYWQTLIIEMLQPFEAWM